MNLCNGTEKCNFQTPKPHIQVCHFLGVSYNVMFDRYTYFYIQYACLTATTALPTRRTTTTIEQITTTEINNANAINYNQDTPDTAVIAGSVVGCILLVIFVIMVVVFILKRKTIGSFNDSRFKGNSRVSNPVYEEPSDSYNNVVFKNDNSPSVNVIKLADDNYNHLHDAKNDNSMTTGNTYNYLGQMGSDYNHLHDNNNRLRVDDQSSGAYNHLGMVNNKTHNPEELHNANYNHIGGSKVDKPDVDYNHLHGDKNDILKADYNHLGENKKTEIPNDYNHIGDMTNETTGDVQGEHTQEDVQYEIADDERGDYSNISERQSNYENFPISGHQTCG
ncbi:GATA zinc finger domain-containing protein 14 [Patella vulgata]|uniref:GATA zinc finger domain-containing protein 14 n=1 Tax=Patella vulgata TaxID=6465 RepID=UPI0024A7FCDA|nr:GATA zinc finger domain-containing protein 14 [Patella vulgata]